MCSGFTKFFSENLDFQRFFSEVFAYEIIGRIAKDGGYDEQRYDQPYVKRFGVLSCKHTGCEKERVTRKKRHEHHACFNENNQEKNNVGECSVIRYNGGQMLIQM